MLSCVAMLLFFAVRVAAQDDYNTRAKQYVEKYAQLAIEEQRISHIPACITLGQGILETEAGNSELMTQANNHFGIKCKNGWTGETFLHTDDAKDECFKKYKSAEDSYRDHSQHLKINPRYSSLFTISLTNYTAWAHGLKRCGYATDPQYAPRLIKIIEDFNLQQYTYAAMDSTRDIAEQKVIEQQTPVAPNPTLVDVRTDTAKPKTTVNKQETDPLKSTADSARNFITHTETIVAAVTAQADFDSTEIVKVNGLKAFYAHKGDMLLQYAMKYNVRYSKLLEINDMVDGPVPADSYIYLEKKLSAGINAQHTVAYGETLWVIAQKEGIQLKKLTALNLLSTDDIPATGAVLQLQFPAAKKPATMLAATTAHKNNSIIIINADDKAIATQDSDYIALRKTSSSEPKTDGGFMHTTDTMVIAQDTSKTQVQASKPSGFPKPRPTAPIVEGPPPVVVVTTKAPEDKNAPLHWVTTDTIAAKKETLTEDEQEAKHEEFASLKSQLDKVVYADDSKLVAKIQSEQPIQKKQEDQPAASKNTKFYTVKKGDTAFSIAKRNNITVKELYKWNDIDASDIKPGVKLKVGN